MVGKQTNPFEYSNNDNPHNVEIPELPAATESSENFAFVQSYAGPSSKPKAWKLWLAALGFCCVLSGVGTAAFWWLTTPPPSPECQKLSPLATDMEQLLCAQESARSGDLPKVLAGLELVARWTPDHPLYREAQRLVAEWSAPVLKEAQQRIDRSDLRGAIELASRIPSTSPMYKEAQAAIIEWKRYWQKGESISMAARKAMKAQNWLLASEKIEALKAFSQDYWRYDRVTALSNLLSAERQGRQILAEAKSLGNTKHLDQLGAAIALLSRIDTRTFAWSDAQKPMKQWSEILLSQGWQNWEQGNLSNAMAFAEPVLKNPNLAQTAQELLWMSQAQKHAFASTTTLKPTLSQLWNLSAAVSTIHLVPSDSRYSDSAQRLLKNWQAQFQDLTLLQLAWGVGDVDYPFTKQFALWQAAQVTTDRPRRAQAQTLVSYWQAEMRKLADQPYLAYARQLAAKETIPALRDAIAQANLITPDRPMRKEAQTLISNWTQQIQAIEDQPILDQAYTLAGQGNLQAAIQVANSVAPGRSLYWQAQSAIAGWQASIQATELTRLREQESSRQRSRLPKNFEPRDFDPESEPQLSTDPETSPPEDDLPTSEVPSPSPSSIYPPGTEPPPNQMPMAPSYAPPYEPQPPQPAAPPYYQPYEPVPPPPAQ